METLAEILAQEYVEIVRKYYPQLSHLLETCHVKVVDCYLERLSKRCFYIAVYCPKKNIDQVDQYHHELKDVAENMGLVEVVVLDVTKIIRDPLSTLKEKNPRLWLELYWIATQDKFS